MRDFLLMFFIVFCATGQAFNMAFGTHLLHYSTSASSMMTLFRALLGDFEYFDLQRTDSVAGPLLFILFVLLVGFILLNMFIAILAEAYSKAKVEVFGDDQIEAAEEWKGAVGLFGARLLNHGLAAATLGDASDPCVRMLRSDYINVTARIWVRRVLEAPFTILKKGSDVYNGDEEAGGTPDEEEGEDSSDEEEDGERFSQIKVLREVLEITKELHVRFAPTASCAWFC